MVIKPVLWAKKRQDGKQNIKIYIYREKVKYISTDYFIDAHDWDGSRVRKSHPNHAHINNAVHAKVLELETQWLREGATVSEIGAQRKKIGFPDFLITYRDGLAKSVSKKGQPLSPHYVKSVKNSIRVIERFFEAEGKRDFPALNKAFYDDFVTWMRESIGYNENSIGRVLKDLKAILKTARRKGLHNSSEYEDFPVTGAETHAIALTPEEIEAIISADLPDNYRREAQRFYISYNFLLRFGDSVSIDEKDLVKRGGNWYLQTTHNKTRAGVVIPLLPKTYGILKELGFSIKANNQVSNRYIKEAARIAGITEGVTITELRNGKLVKRVEPKHKLITTHTARRSMATNLWNSGFDLKQIQLMGGWKSLTSLQKYLRIDAWDNAKKAAEHPFFKRSAAVSVAIPQFVHNPLY